MNQSPQPAPNPPEQQSLQSVVTLVYGLQAASFLLGITFLVAVIIAYIKRSEANDTFLASHFRWQISTFWYALLWLFLGAFSAAFLIGYVVLLGNMVWVIYRIVKGWLYLNDGKPMYVPV